jgi:hypothetical protein
MSPCEAVVETAGVPASTGQKTAWGWGWPDDAAVLAFDARRDGVGVGRMTRPSSRLMRDGVRGCWMGLSTTPVVFNPFRTVHVYNINLVDN